MKKTSKIIVIIAVLAACCLFAVPVNDYVHSKVEYDDIVDNMINVDDNGFLTIDWNGLLSINDSIIAWIDIPGTNISYPVMQVKDNNEYLRRDIYGNSSRSGVIFVDSATINPFEGCNTIIYGHNMLNGQMFSNLRNYKSEEYMNEHDIVYVYFPSGCVYEYQIFSFMTADMYDTDIYDANISQGELTEYYGIIEEKSTLFKNNTGDNVLTLSTCANGSGQRTRSVVHACRLEKKKT